MQKEVYLSKEKLAELKQELESLKKVKRPDIIIKIKEARALGDLSENAEYHSAREEQGRIEGRIEELEYMIKKDINQSNCLDFPRIKNPLFFDQL